MSNVRCNVNTASGLIIFYERFMLFYQVPCRKNDDHVVVIGVSRLISVEHPYLDEAAILYRYSIQRRNHVTC